MIVLALQYIFLNLRSVYASCLVIMLAFLNTKDSSSIIFPKHKVEYAMNQIFLIALVLWVFSIQHSLEIRWKWIQHIHLLFLFPPYIYCLSVYTVYYGYIIQCNYLYLSLFCVWEFGVFQFSLDTLLDWLYSVFKFFNFKLKSFLILLISL